MVTIRGAITVDTNSVENIIKETKSLLEEIKSVNKFTQDQVVCIIFTATKDLNKAYPAKAAREIGYNMASLICLQEMDVEDSLEKCIRVTLFIDSNLQQREVNHVYLKEAKHLRPDIALKKTSIAIDGPASSGKSTIAKLLAKELGYLYIDTGAMYRAITYKIIHNNIDIDNNEELNLLLKYTDIEFKEGDIYLDGINVSEDIRKNEISNSVSKVAAKPEVRNKLVELQQKIATTSSIVMDGRDIGTVVLPNANYKFFITANIEERARRRYKELVEKGENVTLEQIKLELEKRDYMDKTREVSPLKMSDDAIRIDNTDMNIRETIDFITSYMDGDKNDI